MDNKRRGPLCRFFRIFISSPCSRVVSGSEDHGLQIHLGLQSERCVFDLAGKTKCGGWTPYCTFHLIMAAIKLLLVSLSISVTMMLHSLFFPIIPVTSCTESGSGDSLLIPSTATTSLPKGRRFSGVLFWRQTWVFLSIRSTRVLWTSLISWLEWGAEVLGLDVAMPMDCPRRSSSSGQEHCRRAFQMAYGGTAKTKANKWAF